MAAMSLTPSSPVSPSAAAAKESLLLSHAESHDDWAGWCTVESEPVTPPPFLLHFVDVLAIFNQLLWDIGVSHAQIHEIYSLDLESFESIKFPRTFLFHVINNRPVHGLIFLFHWKQEPNEEEVELSCPEDLWFANQVIDNSCASLALLNIILNVPDLDIGDHLSQFRDFTKDFSPPVLCPCRIGVV